MNSAANKLKRRDYVQSLLLVMQEENSHIVYMDETNLIYLQQEHMPDLLL